MRFFQRQSLRRSQLELSVYRRITEKAQQDNSDGRGRSIASCDHLKQGFSRGFVLSESVADERTEHIALRLGLGTKALGHDLLRDSLAKWSAAVFSCSYERQEPPRTHPMKAPKPILSLSFGRRPRKSRDCRRFARDGTLAKMSMIGMTEFVILM